MFFAPIYASSGEIQLILGPMFAGKSTELIRRVRRYQVARRKVVVVKPQIDDRYGSSGVVTHDRLTFPGLAPGSLSEVQDQLMGCDVIGIDEGQFFSDIVEACEALAKAGKTVIVAALDGTYQRRPFENISRLISVADTVEKLLAVCHICSGVAPFSARLTGEPGDVLIGGEDKYVAVCRGCWEKLQSGEIDPSRARQTGTLGCHAATSSTQL